MLYAIKCYSNLLMTPENSNRQSKRHESILTHATEVMADMSFTYGTQSFLISELEARQIGEAVSNRDQRALRDVVDGAVTAATDDYRGTNAAECIGVWNETLVTIFGEDITLARMLEDDDSRELLNLVMKSSELTQLDMDTTAYLKFLETIAVSTMPNNGFKNYPESRRSRSGGTERSLYNRSVSLLTCFADSEPGIRTLRENILAAAPYALDHYLASLVRARSAQTSLEYIIEMDEYDIQRQKADLSRVLKDEQTEHDIEINDLIHVLEWKMLLGDGEDRHTTHKRVKSILESQTKTEFQRRHLFQNWNPERLDFLISIVEQAIIQKRHPRMFISNRFEDGAGVYIAVELDHPHDATHKIAFADNPLSGNALYIVDEVQLENEGHPNGWETVFGSNRRIARERGATRRYHTGNWQGIAPTLLSMGELPNDEKTAISTPEIPLPEIQVHDQPIPHELSLNEILAIAQKAINAHNKLMQNE